MNTRYNSHYKDYLGSFEVDVEAGVIFGRVVGLRDVVTFQGETVAEAVRAFHDSVDDYLEFCAERGEAPERPFSGRFLFRMSPELHRELSAEASARRESINAVIERAVKAHLAEGRARFARIVAERSGGGAADEGPEAEADDHMSRVSALLARDQREAARPTGPTPGAS
jgi:predicted HicB family RNase H-like nuclease